MRGFLARAGHLLGRLAVSLGYGGGEEAHGPPIVCFQTSPAAFETGTEVAEFFSGTEPAVFAFATETMAGFLETKPAVLAFETESSEAAFETEPEGCPIKTEPDVC